MSQRRAVRGRRLALALGFAGVAFAALWWGVHRYPWLGSSLADALRAVVGSRAVTWLEETAYGAEDRVNRVVKAGEQPRAHWDVPVRSAAPGAPSSSAPLSSAGPPGAPEGALRDREGGAEQAATPTRAADDFPPPDVGPVHRSWSAPGDGVWVPVPDARRPEAPPLLYKTLLHPDKNRSWAEVFVVVADLERVRLRAVAGSQEPKSVSREGSRYRRAAKVAAEDLPNLLAAFNGGFKAEHGWHGMKVDGVVLVKPRPDCCTLGERTDGTLGLMPHKAWPEEPVWFRQGPQCMVHDGRRHPGLASEGATGWGATLDGDVVIRRSALGLDAAGRRLFVAITNHTTARALADGMVHAGAVHVTQMDVNWSYPKFVLYEPGEEGKLRAVPLAKGFEHADDEYVGRRSMRDFFYLVRR